MLRKLRIQPYDEARRGQHVVTPVRVIDGDSLMVRLHRDDRGRRPIEVRLVEIDAPEYFEPLHAHAGRVLRRLLGNLDGPLLLDDFGLDPYGRTLGVLLTPGADRQRERAESINTEMVRLGAAWWYPKYSLYTDLAMNIAHSLAVSNQRGIHAP